MSESHQEEQNSDYRLPNSTTLQHVAKLSIRKDKPVMFDYGQVLIKKF